MNAVDVLCWIIIGGAFLFVAFLGIACVIMASKYDDISEEQWKQYQAEHGDEEDSL